MNETINNFLKEIPNVLDVLNNIKKYSKEDVVSKYKIKNEEWEGRTNEDVRAILENKYEKIEEVHITIENSLRERNKQLRLLNDFISRINELELIYIKYDYIREGCKTGPQIFMSP